MNNSPQNATDTMGAPQNKRGHVRPPHAIHAGDPTQEDVTSTLRRRKQFHAGKKHEGDLINCKNRRRKNLDAPRTDRPRKRSGPKRRQCGIGSFDSGCRHIMPPRRSKPPLEGGRGAMSATMGNSAKSGVSFSISSCHPFGTRGTLVHAGACGCMRCSTMQR